MFKNIPIYLFLFFLFKSTIGISQLFYNPQAWDTLNQVDTEGRKTGYWVTYLNQYAEPVDSSLSYYFGFELYQNGKPLFKFNKTKWKQKLRLQTNANLSEPGHPVVLNGAFKWYAPDSLIIFEEEYEYGKPIYFRAYHYTKEGVNGFNEILYYNMPYNNELGSFYYEETTENRVIRREYICPGRKRNKTIKVKGD